MIRFLPLKYILPCGLAFLPAVSLRAGDPHWVSVRSPSFTVLTTESGQVARTWAIELERFRQMLQQVVAPGNRLRPVTVVLFSSERAMRPFKPLEKGKPQNVDGLFVDVGDSHAIELNLESDPGRIRRIIFHEAVHWFSSASDQAMPLWLEEGVAEVYSTFEVKPDGRCFFGGTIDEHVALLRGLRAWSMEKLVTTSRDSLLYNEGSRATEFYAQAWLATHYLLFGQGTPGKASIAAYLEAMATSAGPAPAFQKAFGVDYAGFYLRLAAYVKGGHYSLSVYRPPEDGIEKLLVTKPATDAEIQLALGILLMGARHEFTPEAESRLQRAAVLAPENPRVWQALGEGALLGKQYDEAEKYFTRAVAAGSDSYYAFYGLGNCRLHGLDNTNGFLDSSAALQSLRDFRHALALNPRFLPAYEAVAGLIYATDTYEPKDRDLLEQGRRLAPENSLIDVGLAACDLRADRRAKGRQRLALILQTPRGVADEARRLAADLLQTDEWNAFTLELNALFDGGHYAEVVARIDAAGGKFPGQKFRDSLRQNRRHAVGAAQLHEAVELANHGDLPAARRAFQAILDSDLDQQVKGNARRLLDEIAKILAPAGNPR